MKLHYDFSNFQEADNEVTATTYWGGSFNLNGKDYPVGGNDRDGSLETAVEVAAEEALGRSLTKEESELLFSQVIAARCTTVVEFEDN